ncbi:unnamed protein product [Heligmosomoides polygyrus]|uniref:PH domain-containing protein n=1 Tax=Heligmosomoides polygyrus TaxID=6339 RepID=A0A183GDS6_HELPZ|nr:unnamed protein product [Heligmosomoides polygyrus]
MTAVFYRTGYGQVKWRSADSRWPDWLRLGSHIAKAAIVAECKRRLAGFLLLTDDRRRAEKPKRIRSPFAPPSLSTSPIIANELFVRSEWRSRRRDIAFALHLRSLQVVRGPGAGFINN